MACLMRSVYNLWSTACTKVKKTTLTAIRSWLCSSSRNGLTCTWPIDSNGQAPRQPGETHTLQGPINSRMKHNRPLFALQIFITFVLLFMLFRSFNWPQFLSILAGLPPVYYLCFLLLLTVGQLVYAFRWYLILRTLGIQVGYPQVIQQYFIALFFSNFLPTAIGGDVSKIYYLGQQAGYVKVGASVFIDRFLGFFWLTVVGTLMLWLLNIS